jgi:5-methylcytosine-specific restriction endonuclease McrA
MTKPCVDCGVLVRDCSRCLKCHATYRTSKLSASKRGYDSKWRRLSKELRRLQPWCSFCGLAADLTVDHIVPLSMGGSNEVSNLRVLCRSCNSGR